MAALSDRKRNSRSAAGRYLALHQGKGQPRGASRKHRAAVGQAATHSAATFPRASSRDRLKGTPIRTRNPGRQKSTQGFRAASTI